MGVCRSYDLPPICSDLLETPETLEKPLDGQPIDFEFHVGMPESGSA